MSRPEPCSSASLSQSKKLCRFALTPVASYSRAIFTKLARQRSDTPSSGRILTSRSKPRAKIVRCTNKPSGSWIWRRTVANWVRRIFRRRCASALNPLPAPADVHPTSGRLSNASIKKAWGFISGMSSGLAKCRAHLHSRSISAGLIPHPMISRMR